MKIRSRVDAKNNNYGVITVTHRHFAFSFFLLLPPTVIFQSSKDTIGYYHVILNFTSIRITFVSNKAIIRNMTHNLDKF